MRRFPRSTRWALLSVMALTLIPTGIGFSEATAQESDTTSITMVVPNPSCFVFYPLYVAIQEGYYADRGLDITVEAVDGSASVLQAMAGGQAQLGAPGPG